MLCSKSKSDRTLNCVTQLGIKKVKSKTYINTGNTFCREKGKGVILLIPRLNTM